MTITNENRGTALVHPGVRLVMAIQELVGLWTERRKQRLTEAAILRLTDAQRTDLGVYSDRHDRDRGATTSL